MGSFYGCVVPCVDSVDREWVRGGAVVALGELFMRLGKEFSGKKIYAFFRALRLVALKRDKTATSKAPGSASAKLKALGTSGGPCKPQTSSWSSGRNTPWSQST